MCVCVCASRLVVIASQGICILNLHLKEASKILFKTLLCFHINFKLTHNQPFDCKPFVWGFQQQRYVSFVINSHSWSCRNKLSGCKEVVRLKWRINHSKLQFNLSSRNCQNTHPPRSPAASAASTLSQTQPQPPSTMNSLSPLSITHLQSQLL